MLAECFVYEWIGSSPRVRGARSKPHTGTDSTGIIPACAGSTRGWKPLRGRGRDHPRVCGEHLPLLFFLCTYMGSSPRVRGALALVVHEPHGDGIIPACAGSTRMWGFRRRHRRDHPRVCGEHSGSAFAVETFKGSSPRVRGARGRQGRAQRVPGIIPACAGSTCPIKSNSRAAGDHPRVCGEHAAERAAAEVWAGSSPRVRGARVLLAQDLRGDGIIPACAGSTTGRATCTYQPRDHPRVCGEHPDYIDTKQKKKGSSPRVRGALTLSVASLMCSGIIPACAGSTSRLRALPGRPSDHPRVCGEHSTPSWPPASTTGSSPRVRGARRLWQVHARQDGIIPACAGST